MFTRQQPTGNGQQASTPPLGVCPQHIVEELEAVVNEIQTFLENFCERFETLTTQFSTLPADFTDDDYSADALGDWEAKRIQAEQSIRAQVDLLTSAWLRLEDEQRSLLQTKQGLANEQKARATTSHISSASMLQCLPGSLQTAAKTEHSAVDAFERLRQEIQSSRPHTKTP